MTHMKQLTRTGIILLILTALGVAAVSADPVTVDLELTKVLQSGGPVFAGEPLAWIITLRNNATVNATNVTVNDDPAGLGNYTLANAVASAGSFENLVWSIPELPNETTASLTLITVINESGEKVNKAAITALDQIDSDPADNTASAITSVGASTTASITIKPETLNLKSRGVFTVFIRFDHDLPLSSIDLGGSFLICNGATPQRLQVTQKDGGTVMAKYRRQDLVNVSAGPAVTITCNGTISAGGEAVKVTGSDTIRVIGQKKTGLDAFFAGILDTILPVDDEAADEGSVNETATPTPATSSQDSKNRGQLKKAERSGDSGCTQDCVTSDSQGANENRKKNGKAHDDSVTGSDGKSNKGNGNGKENEADTGTGNGNGKGNRDSDNQNNGKGNGKNKD